MNNETLLFILGANLVLTVVYSLILRISDSQIKMAFIAIVSVGFGLLLKRLSVFDYKIYALYFIVPSITLTILIWLLIKLIYGKKQDVPTSEFAFIYNIVGKLRLIINNPFRGFGIFGGAGSGKTKSITKPTIANCARLNFAGIIYDYKEFDLTRCAVTQYAKHNSSVKLRFVNFFDMEKTERINPLHPSNLINPAYASQSAMTIIRNLIKTGDNAESFFSDSAEAGLAGIIWRLREDFPEYCNLPYATAISLNSNPFAIIEFIKKNRQAALIAAPFIQSAISEKQYAGVIGTLSSALRKLALPEIFYPLSGNEFSLNLNDPQNPTLLCISNQGLLEDVYAPVIALIINTSLKLMNQPNKHPSIVLLDEATTVKIPNFDNIPATARENKIVTFFICQDMVQGESTYGRIGRDKILANLANQLYGLVRDPQTADRYSKMFGKIEKEYVSHSVSSGTHGSTSKSTSLREVDRYPPQIFQQLNSGEFYGVFADSNHQTFHGTFELFAEPEMDIADLRTVTKDDIIKNFNEILSTAEQIILQ